MNYIRSILNRNIKRFIMDKDIKKPIKFEEIDLSDPRMHQRAVRSALKLVDSPSSYERSVTIIKRLIEIPTLSHKIRNQLFAGIEHVTSKVNDV